MVTQSIVLSSLSLRPFAVVQICPSRLSGRLEPIAAVVANVAAIIVVVLTQSGSVFDILLSVARLGDSATAETNADFGTMYK